MKLITIVMLAATLSACVTTPTTMDLPAPVETKPKIDRRLLEECPALGTLIDNPRPSDVLKQHGADTKMYSDCRDGKKKLIDAVKAAFD
mgnify:CR=1 FL=1